MGDNLMLTDPAGLRLLLLIPVIVLLYMVRSRYRRRWVSSTMLWRSVRRDLEARQRLRLPPLSLLMLLQLLAVAVSATALAKPALPAQDRTHLVILLDVSASMQATDVAPSRFQAALRRAHQAIQQTRPGDQISLVQVGASPALVASGTESTEILASLDHLQPGAASADVVGALELAESLIRETGGQGSVLLLSDGAFGASFRPPALGVPVDFRPIGVSGDNLGITAVDVRPDLDASGRWGAFARVSNFGEGQVEVAAVATADGLLLDTRQLRLAPRISSELAFALPAGAQTFSLEIDGGDPLPADDRVEVRIDTPQSRKVLLVSSDPGPIEKVLESLPGLNVSTVQPDSYASAGEADLVILDGFVPETLPDTDLLIINPPVGAPGLATHPLAAESPVLRSLRSSPLVASVDLQSLRLGQMVRLDVPQWAHAVAEGPSGPLILQGYRSGRKAVIFSFDWFLFDLPRMQAFPLLLSNAISELNPLSLPRTVQPGESVLVRPLADASEATVQMPDGSHRQISLAEGAYSLGETRQVGRYVVKWKSPRLGEIASSFHVNVASEDASDIAPRQHVFDGSRATRGFSAPVPGRQLWPLLTLLTLGLLSAEWIYFSRRS